MPAINQMVGLLAVICFTFATISVANAKGRIALLLGAEKYQHFKSSNIKVAQSRALEEALRGQGFEVTLVANPGNAAARAALTEFARNAEVADFALIVAAGHYATYRKRSFYLPTNARVRRATDLFSRGLSVESMADIVGSAKAGAFLMVVSVPDIPSTIAGVGAQPTFDKTPGANTVVTISTSSKIPVSRVESVSIRVMRDLVEVAGEKPMMLSALVDTATAGGGGQVIGDVKERDLSKDPEKPKPRTVQSDQESEAERQARILAKQRLDQAEERAKRAELRAREAEERAKRERAAAEAERKAAAARVAAEAEAKRELAAAVAAARKKAEEERQKAEEERTRAEEERKKAEEARQAAAARPAPPVATQPEAPANPPQVNIQSLQVVEALLGRGQRRVIQRILKEKGFYDGQIDAVFGEMTRAAIREFQRQSGEEVTGYLTPDQLQRLVASR